MKSYEKEIQNSKTCFKRKNNTNFFDKILKHLILPDKELKFNLNYIDEFEASLNFFKAIKI